MTKLSHHGYSAGHPWYYLLGGKTPTLKEIRAHAETSEYKGYLAEDIEAIGRRTEPQRSAAIKAMRRKIEEDLRRDVSRYRQCTHALHEHRQDGPSEKHSNCSDIHTSISLKFNHIYNGFANLKSLKKLPEQQLDLFEC